MTEWSDAYLVAVADSLVFALSPTSWARLASYDSAIVRSSLTEPLATLARSGIEVCFGDGTLPTLTGGDQSAIARVRETVRRIRELAPHVLGAAPLAFERFVCTDPWPRIYTSAVLDRPATTPVHLLQASDTSGDVDRWQQLTRLHALTEVRALIMFGSPGGLGALDLATFRSLTILDLEGSRLRTLPTSIAGAVELEALYLASNPLSIDALDVLRTLPRLRYVGLRETGIDASAAESLRALLPPGCVFEV